jgi:hypothetical protein
MPRSTTSMEERYRPYRSARKPERARRIAKLPDEPRPTAVGGMRLHIFPPNTTARRRRIRLLFVALLAVTAWGVVSVRNADMRLADYRTATVELLVEMPYLIAAGPAAVSGMLKMPRDGWPAWFTSLSGRVRSLLPR